MRALGQRGADVALHPGKRLFRVADLVAPAAGGEDAASVFRRGAKRGHRPDQPADRAHQREIQRQKHQKAGRQRDRQADQERAQGEFGQRRADRPFLDDRLDELPAAEARRIDDPQRARAIAPQRLRRVADGRHPVFLTQVVDLRDGLGHLVGEEQKPGFVALERHRHRAGVGQQFLPEARADLIVLGRLQRQNGGLRRSDAGAQQILMRARHKGRIDQQLHGQREENRQEQQAARQRAPDAPASAISVRVACAHRPFCSRAAPRLNRRPGRWAIPAQPALAFRPPGP